MNPKDVRTLHSNCEHSHDGLFRVHLTEADYAALLTEVERLTAERNGARAEVAFLKRHYSMEAASRLRAELATAKAKVDLLTAEVEKINPCRLIDVGEGPEDKP